MIAIFDACTLINLLLSVNDVKYINYAEKIFNEIIIVDKVYTELKDNRNDNGVDEEFKDEYEKIIFSYLNRFIAHSTNQEASDFVKAALNYKKINGEFFSVSHALYTSRFGSEKTSSNHLLEVHFITDDDPATKEFTPFYELNHIGRILCSIDLLIICCFKGLIPKSDVMSYCQALKFLYNKPISELVKELKFLLEKNVIRATKEQMIANTMIQLINELNDETIENLSLLIERNEAKTLLTNNNHLKKLIDNVLKSSFREKIPAINRKREGIEKIWLIDYTN